MKKPFMKVFFFILLILTLLGTLNASLNTYATENNEIKLNVLSKKKLEVVLSKKESNMDVTNFQNNVYDKLKELGVDTNLVEFHDAQREEVSTTQSDAETIFTTWEKIGAKGQWSYNNGMIINAENGEMTGYYYPDKSDYQDITLKYNNRTTNLDDDDAMGGMIRFKKNDDNTFSGYVLMITKKDESNFGGALKKSGLYKIENKSFTQFNLKLVKEINAHWNNNIWASYKIEAKGNNIKVYKDNSPILEYTDNNNPIYSGSYGFFSWSQANSIYKDIEIESVSYKSFNDVLLNTTFNPNKIHAVINIADDKEEEFEDEKLKGTILSRTINEKIHYIGLGTEKNEDQIKDFISKNDNKGTFINNTEYEKAVQETAEYIKSLLEEYQSNSEYMVLGEDTSLNVTPEELKTGTADNTYVDGKWKIVHDHTYFENNNGQYENSGKYLSDLPDTFTKVGRYEVFYQDQNINPQYIYVHRRPEAIITMTREGNNITLSSENSYDLDKKSEKDNGISEVEWSYKKIDETDWKTGQLENIEEDAQYIVRLRVQDLQGAWSEYATKFITTQDEIPPIADFTIVDNEITKYENVEIIDNSYDPAGQEITNREWNIKKDGEVVYTGEDYLEGFQNKEAGDYEISLKVTNASGLESEVYTKTMKVTEDEIAPEVIAKPRAGNTINENQQVEIEFYDEGGSGFSRYQYAILDTDDVNKENVQWSEERQNSTDTIEVSGYGDNYIYIKAYDNAGNESIIILGKYHIDNKKVQVEIEKEDKSNENIKLGNAVIKIDESEVTTDEEGKAQTSILAKREGTHQYNIEETQTPRGYDSISTSQLNVTYDDKGDVTQVNSTNEDVVVTGFEKEKISLKIKDNKQEVQGYKLQVEAVDIQDETTKVKGATYKIEIEADSGEQIVLEQQTDENGNIEIPNLGTIGETRIKITQTNGAPGYKKSDEVTYLTINRKENGDIEVVSEKTSEDIAGELQDNLVKVQVTNERKEDENRVIVDVLEGNDTFIEGLKFTLKDEFGVSTLEGRTDENGNLRFENVLFLGEGDFIYSIIPEANNIYGLEEIKVAITFDSNGRITNIKEITSQTSEVKIDTEEDEQKVYSDAHIKLSVQIKESYQKQQIKILKVDQNDPNKKLAGVMYKVKQKTSEMIKTTKKATDNSGELNIDIIKSDKIELTIQELKSIDGYILDDTTKNITLVKNKNTNLMEVDKNNTSENVDVRIDDNGNITIVEKNQKKIENEAAKAYISFFIDKLDILGNKLGHVKFALVEEKTGSSYELETDENGYAELKDFEVPKEGTYEFSITEVKTATGYDIATAPIKLIISYEEFEGEMKTSQIVVARGYKYIKYKECDEYETDKKFQLDIHMTIQNNAIETEIGDVQTRNVIGTIEATKVDLSTDEELGGAKYEVKVEYQDGTTIKQIVETKDIEKVFNSIYFKENEKVIITFKEIQAPVGYVLDTNEKKVVVKNDRGVLKASGDIKADIKNNKIVQVELQDYKNNNKMGGNLLRYNNIEGYTLKIVNQNTYNDKLKLEGSTFNTKIMQSGIMQYNQNRYLGSDPDDMNTVEFENLKIDGNQQIIIKQTVAPLHHIINDETYTIDIERDITTRDVNLISKSNNDLNVSINNNERTITVIIKNEPAEILMTINKVDEEDHSIGLGNVGFRINKYVDKSDSDLRTNAYIRTESNGVGYGAVSTYVTNGTELYTIDEVNTPEGYYPNKKVGIYITVDKEGNIKSASPVENANDFASGRCTIDKIDGKYMELTIINTRKPEPTYSVIVDNINKYDKYTKVEGSVFNFEIKQQEGANISTNVTTNENGIATVGNLNGKGKIDIRIEQISAGDTYKKDPIVKHIQIDRNIVQSVTSTGNVYTKRISFAGKDPQDIEVIINNQKQEVIIKVYNERTFGIEIEKIGHDKEKEEINLPGAKFELYQGDKKLGEVITDSWGRGYIYMGNSPKNQTIRYTLKETQAPVGYETISDCYLDVVFNKAGEITRVDFDDKDNCIKNKSYSEEYILLQILEPEDNLAGGENSENENENKNETYSSLEIAKEGFNNQKLNIGNVVFSIYVEAEDGRTMRVIRSTDDKGKIQLKGIPGNKIKITLQEIETANGYVLDNKERTIVLEKIKINGKEKLRLVKEESASDLNIHVDENKREVRVTIKNEISEDKFGLAVIKEDSEDELLTIEGATYEIKDEETGEIYSITTGDEGAALTMLEPKKEAGIYTYKIKEIKAPEGYTLNEEEIELEVTYELDEAGNPYIKTAKIKSEETTAEIQNQTKNYVEIHTKNQPTDNGIEPYDIIVRKVDRDDLGIVLPDAELKIDVANSQGQTGLSKTDITDKNGEIKLNNIKGAGNIQIDITEIVPPPGRKFDLKEKKSLLTKDPITGRLKLIDSINVDTIINNKEKIITILVRNEIEDGNYSLVVEKNDIDNKNISLSNVKMKIEIPGEKEAREVVTDKEGRIVLTNLPMPKEGKYNYKIKEIETLEGYKIIKDEIVFKVVFKENEEGEMISGAEITKGKDFAMISQTLPKYISLNIYNEKDSNEQDQKYSVSVKKVDGIEKDIPIEGVKIKLKIEYENGNGYVIEEKTDANGKIIITDLITKGIAKITVQEIETVEGYDLDGKERIVECNINESGEIVVSAKDEQLDTNVKDKELEITMTNDRSDEYINLHLEKYISKINNAETGREPKVVIGENGEISYDVTSDKEDVKIGDIVEFTMRVYNEGTQSGYAQKVTDIIPDGLEYIEDNEINKENKWKKVEDNKYQTDKLSKETSEDNIIEAYDAEKGLFYKEVKIVLKVVEKKNQEAETQNIGIIEEEKKVPNKDDNNVKDPENQGNSDNNQGNENTEEKGKYEEDNKNKEEFNIKYVKFAVDKKVNKITTITNGKSENQNVTNGEMAKVEINRKTIENTDVEVEYIIKVTNTGTLAGNLSKIIDEIPEGMQLVTGKNAGWNNGQYTVNRTINPGESVSVNIVLRCKASQIGTKTNIAKVEGDGEESSKTSGKAEVIVSIKTGKVQLYLLLTGTILLMFGTGVYYIKKYII